jgi:hypothetical protein
VESAVAFLERSGYRSIGQPLVINSVPFEFDAALVGTRRSTDLIVVVDTAVDEAHRAAFTLSGLAAALDSVGSRLALTTLLVGAAPRRNVLDQLTAVSRVMISDGSEKDLARSVAVLLPLQLPVRGVSGSTDPLQEVAGRLAAVDDLETLRRYESVAVRGGSSVAELLRNSLEAPLVPLVESDPSQA